jgi:hypothetical protein
MSQHFQVGEIFRDSLLLEGRDKGVIGVEVGDYLETAREGNDLAL